MSRIAILIAALIMASPAAAQQYPYSARVRTDAAAINNHPLYAPHIIYGCRDPALTLEWLAVLSAEVQDGAQRRRLTHYELRPYLMRFNRLSSSGVGPCVLLQDGERVKVEAANSYGGVQMLCIAYTLPNTCYWTPASQIGRP
jgi:hypothetical protein